MRSRFHFNAKGQASLEFILVLIFMLVIVTGVVVPLGQRLQSALEDISIAGSVSAGESRIASDMDALLSTPSNGLLFRDIFLPKGAKLECDPDSETISFSFPVNRAVYKLDGSTIPGTVCIYNPVGSVPAMECNRTLAVPSNVSLNCQGSSSESFTVETGAAGFTQRFRMGSMYASGASPNFTIDFSTG